MLRNVKGLAGRLQFFGRKPGASGQEGGRDIDKRLKAKSRKLKKKNEKIKTLEEKLAERDRELAELRAKLAVDGAETGGLSPESMVWIVGSPRTGSTWLSHMLGELKGCRVWQEPFFGVILSFRDNIANQGYAANKNFLFGEPNKPIWLEHMKRLFLAVGEAKFGCPERLVIKEPNGSVGAHLVLEAFPESSVILLVRDPRDVVASLLDAAKPGSWYGYDRYEASAASARFDPETGSFAFPQPPTEDEYIKCLSQDVVRSFVAAREAFNAHDGCKALIRYEDLRVGALDTMKELCSKLGIVVDERQLTRVVEKFSWENIPAEKKGKGRRLRKAAPGSWRGDLTPQQAEIVERVAASLLNEFYRE